MATPDTKNSVVIKKQFTYRGATRVFSNRYHFEGDLPANDADWQTFTDAIVDAEKAIYSSEVRIVEAIGYDASTASATNPHGDSVFTATYSTLGTGTFSTDGRLAPGDAAILLRWSTPARSKRNHPVYLMNYFHSVWADTSDPDTVASSQVNAVEAYGLAWQNGFSDGSETHERCGPRGAVSTGHIVSPFVRHRDFPA